jgi:transcriptional regulator with XRE-family HTH domain
MNYDQKKSEYRREVGKRLKVARESADITQEIAAERLGRALGKELPSSRIGNYEQGTRLPDPLVIQILCSIYGNISPSAILGFPDAIMGKDEQALFEKYRTTDDRGKRAIHGVADAQSGYEVTPEKQEISEPAVRTKHSA